MTTYARYQADAIDTSGNLLTGNLSVEVRKESDNSLASVFSDRAGATPLGNPFTITDGHVAFHAVGGAYKVTLTQGAFTRTLRYVPLGTAEEADLLPSSTSDAGIVQLASTTEQLTGTDNSKAATPDSIAALWEKGSNVASASTVSLGEGGLFHITGTTTITDIDFGTAKDGRRAILIFDGALTLTNSSTLKLPGGANITTAAGDRCEVVQENGDTVYVSWYQKANGQAVNESGVGRRLVGTPRFITSSQTVSPSSGVTLWVYLLVGGGGGGGAASAASQASGAAGGGGAGAEVWGSLANPTATALTVGAAGTGSTSTGSAGNNGGISTFNSDTANGGVGGNSIAGTGNIVGVKGGAGGTASGGDLLNVNGNAGEGGQASGVSGNSNQSAQGGRGGSGQYGHGGQGGSVQGSTGQGANGSAGSGIGAGGGGAGRIDDTTTSNGGDGTAGGLILWEFA